VNQQNRRWETDLPFLILGQIRRLLYVRTRAAPNSRALGAITCLMLLSSFRNYEAFTNHVWG